MHPIFIKAMVFLLLSSCCREVFGQELLDQLSVQLNAARSILRVEPIRCTVAMDALVGVPGDVVVSKLSRPDLSEVGHDSDGEFIVV
nr:orf87EGC147 [uncultured bacterium]